MNNTTYGFDGRSTSRLHFEKWIFPILQITGDSIVFIVTCRLSDVRGNTGRLLKSHLVASLATSVVRFVMVFFRGEKATTQGNSRLSALSAWESNIVVLLKNAVTTLSCISIHTLCILCVNLSLAVILGRRYNNLLTCGKTIGVILCTWIFNALILFMPLSVFKDFIYPKRTKAGSTSFIVGFWSCVSIVAVAVPGIVSLTFYVKLKHTCRDIHTLAVSVQKMVHLATLVAGYNTLHIVVEFFTQISRFAKVFGTRASPLITTVYYSGEVFNLSKILVYMLLFRPFRERIFDAFKSGPCSRRVHPSVDAIS